MLSDNGDPEDFLMFSPFQLEYVLMLLLHVWNLELSPFPTNLMVSDLPYSFKCFVGKVIFRAHRPSKPIWYNLQLHVVSPRHLLQYKGPNNLEHVFHQEKLELKKTWGLNLKKWGLNSKSKPKQPPNLLVSATVHHGSTWIELSMLSLACSGASQSPSAFIGSSKWSNRRRATVSWS